MGYVLNFWRYADETAPRAPEEHVIDMQALYRGEDAETVPLPLSRLAAALREPPAGWRTDDGSVWEREGVSIEFDLSPRLVHAELRGAWTGDDANLVIGIFSDGFGLPLFDPQGPRRFATQGAFRP